MLNKQDFKQELNDILDQESQFDKTPNSLINAAVILVRVRILTHTNRLPVLDAVRLVEHELDELMRQRVLKGDAHYTTPVRIAIKGLLCQLEEGW